MMVRFVLPLLLVSLGMNALASAPVRIATAAVNPPFAFLNEESQLTGFDIDLANALCQRLQQACVFTSNDFDRLLPSLKFQRYDVVISGMDVTTERQKQVDFTQPYFINSATLIAAKDRYATLEQLKGKRVGVGAETTHQAWLASTWPDIIAVSYDNYQNALLDIHNSRIDGIIGDTPSMHEVLKSHPELAAVGQPVTDSRFFGYGVAMAVRKNNSVLKNRLNDALQSLSDDGTLRQLRLRWFGTASGQPSDSSK